METGTSQDSVVSLDEPPLCTVGQAVQQPEVQAGLQPPQAGQRPSRWNDWRWQIRNRVRSVQELEVRYPSLRVQPDVARVAEKYPLAITPYYASIIRKADYSDPVFRMSVPAGEELCDPPFLKPDPLEEDADMPVPGLVHRYRDRALVMATTTCSMYCRHCTRKRVAGTRETTITPARIRQIQEYLCAHPEIKDVIISGGDPLTMSTSLIERVLSAVRSAPGVELIRIGTRTPVVLPQRITPELTSMLRKYHPLWINTHFNHPNELTPEAAAACAAIVDAGIPLGNQSVLLRGINDRPEVMAELCRGLVRMRVKPYYLFQCDLVRGVEHFRTPISRGLEIMEYLRGRVSGLAIPTFVVDTPHGGGKVPLLPNYVVSVSPTHTVLRNYEGMLMSYPEPQVRCESPAPDAAECGGEALGVWQLTSGKADVLAPAGTSRQLRRAQQKPKDA